MLEDLCKRGDPTSLRYASVITEQKKCWDLLAQTFDRFQTLCNNSQQHVTGWANGSNRNIQQCWELLANNVHVAVCTGPMRNACCWERFPCQDLYCWMLIKPALNHYNWQKTLFNLYRTTFSLRYLNVLKRAPGLSNVGKNSGGAHFRQLPQ